jgi:pimeloyl-ACP methyl ester carboxylesterase
MSAIIVDDDVVHYEVLGRGRPLIFVHGWLGSWRYWIPTMQALSGEFRTYALDLWGFGDSAKRPDRYSLEGQADLLKGFMERLAILKAAFVGHGLGGAVLAHFARKYPELADRAMAVSVPLTGAAINGALLATPLANLIEAFIGRGPQAEPISREAAKTDLAAVETSVRALTEADLSQAVEHLALPYLLVYGEKDSLVTPPSNGLMQYLTNNVHSIELEESRHFPMLDEAARFNRLLVDFLSLKSGESLTNLELKEEWQRRVR